MLAIVGVLGLATIVPLQIATSRMQTRAEQEFLSITPPPDAKAMGPISSSTRINAVWNIYSSALSYEELRAFYDQELAKHGWKFDEEESAIYGFGGSPERSGKNVFYEKGIYTATIHYAGPREARESEYSYEFTVEWSWLNVERSLHKHSAPLRRWLGSTAEIRALPDYRAS